MSTPIDIQGILRVDTKQTDLTVAQYNGQARPGELVVDLTTYSLYVANIAGNLSPVLPPPPTIPNIVNGTSTIDIPVINGNVNISAGGTPNVVVFAGDTVTYQANLIPNVDSVYSIGNATRQWKDLWVSGTTIYIGGVPISSNSTSNTLSVAGNTVVTASPTGVTQANSFVANSAVIGNATITGNLSTSNLAVTGISNLGPIGNVKITGGVANNVIMTDGTGNLSFRAFDTLGNGTSNISVPVANGNVSITSAGNLVFQVGPAGTTTTGNATVVGNSIVTGNASALNFNTAGNVITGRLTVTGVTNLGNVGNVLISGGLTGQALVSNGSGGMQWTTIGGAANGTYIANGTSSVSVPLASGNVQVVSNSTTVMQIGKTLTTFLTDVSAGNVSAANISGTGMNVVINSNSYLTTFDHTGNTTFTGNAVIQQSLTVGGVSNLGPVGNVRITGGTTGQVLTTNGSGGLSWASGSSSLANGSSSIAIPAVNGNIILQSGGVAIGNIASTGLDVTSPLSANTLLVRGVSNLGPASNLRISGGLINQVLTATGAGTVVWANVTATGVTSIGNGGTTASVNSFDGPLILTSATGVTANISDQFYVSGNMVLSSNLTVQRTSYLGPVSNVKITGGTSGQVLKTDGLGGLSWVSVAGVGAIANIANGNTSVFTYDSNTTVQISTNNTLRMNFVDGNISVLAPNTTVYGNFVVDSTVPNITLGTVANVRIAGGTSGQVLTTNGSSGLSWTSVSLATIANTTSNVNIPTAAGNVNISVGGTANVVAVTATGANIAGTANVTGVTSTPVVHESSVALGAGSAINVSSAAVFSKTVTAATTFTVTNVPASGKVASFILDLTNGGAFAVTWWAGTKWASGTSPSLTVSGRDVLGFFTYDGGTTWTGLLLGRDVK